MKFNHLGIPTKDRFKGEIDLPHLKMTVSDHENNPYGIQWQRYWDNAPYPELVKTVPHVAFVVDDLQKAIEGKNVIIQPNSPSEGLMVAFIEENGAPIELMQYENKSI
jgi:diaminopimelate epimerase